MENETPKIGDHVIYTDEQRRDHHALLTAVHGTGKPAVNLLFVVDDPARNDPYGNQIERRSSCVHRSHNSAAANCWRLPSED